METKKREFEIIKGIPLPDREYKPLSEDTKKKISDSVKSLGRKERSR